MTISGIIRYSVLALLLQCLSANASYHTADRLIQTDNPNRSISHSLDGYGYRLTEAITDATGAVTSRYTWDTWGNLQQQTGSSQQPFGFTGYQRDEQTGLHYAQQRYYDAEIGWINRHDPFRGDINIPLSLHRYLYANANPIIFVDPDGREACIGAPLVNCPLDQFVPNNRSIPIQVSEQAIKGIPETTAVAEDQRGGLVSLPPSAQVFTRNFRLVPQIDPKQPDGVIAFNAIALDNEEGQFRIAPRDLDVFVRDEEKFRNLAAFNETTGGSRALNVRTQRALTEFLNRGLLGLDAERSITGEIAASFKEAATDPVFIVETAFSFVGGVRMNPGRVPVRGDIPRGGFPRNAIDGARREAAAISELRSGPSMILEQRTIFRADGRAIASDGKGRRLDACRIEGGCVTEAFEITSPTEALRPRKIRQVERGNELISNSESFVLGPDGEIIIFTPGTQTTVVTKQ